MKKGSTFIVTLVQLLILCAMFATAFLVPRGFFNDLLTAKQYGLEICALFGMVLLALTLIAAALVLPPAQSRAAWIAGMVGCLFVLASHPAFKSTWNNLKKRIRSFTRPIQALSVWQEVDRWYNFRAYQEAVKSSATKEIMRETKKNIKKRKQSAVQATASSSDSLQTKEERRFE